MRRATHWWEHDDEPYTRGVSVRKSASGGIMALPHRCCRTLGRTSSLLRRVVTIHARAGTAPLSGMVAAALVALGSTAGRADVFTFVAARDNTLYEVSPDTLSNGKGSNFFVGLPGIGHPRRGLIAFDIGGVVRSGATVNSVKLRLHVS